MKLNLPEQAYHYYVSYKSAFYVLYGCATQPTVRPIPLLEDLVPKTSSLLQRLFTALPQTFPESSISRLKLFQINLVFWTFQKLMQ